MERAVSPAQNYRVSIRPAAWQQIGTLPAAVFAEVTERLDEVAEMASLVEGPQESALAALGAPLLAFQVAEVVVLYQVDSVARMVVLVEFAKRLHVPGASSGTSAL